VLKFLLTSAFCALCSVIPIGPVNLEIIQRMLRNMVLSATMLMLGAALAEGCWAVLAFSSVSPLLAYIEPSHFFIMTPVLFFVGAGVLFWFGVSAVRQFFYPSAIQNVTPKSISYTRAFVSGFILVITNPLTYAFWSGSFIWMQRMQMLIKYRIWSVFMLASIVVMFTFSYLYLVGYITYRFKERISMQKVSKISFALGCLLFIFCFYFLYNGIHALLI
jgi:L-lysine exporter family protein LysE/ArgO